MIAERDIPDFLRFVENAVATEIGGTISHENANLIQRVATTLLAAHHGELGKVHLLTQEIAELRQDPTHRPEQALQLEIIRQTKRLCEEMLAQAA